VLRLRTERGYIEKYGVKKAEKFDLIIPIYHLTPRAYLAILLDKTG